MTDRVDMSLDDIIKRDKIAPGRRGGRGAGRGSSRSGPAARGRRTGGPVKKISAVGRQMKPGGAKRTQNLSQKTPQRQLNSDKWQHDKFVGEVKSASLMISNLDFQVSDNDIRELFSEFGPLKKASVHYDSSGRSLGKADVVFVKIADAIRAQKKYNGVPLDGRAMSIQPLVTSAVKASIASRIGNGEGFKKQPMKSNPPRGRPRQGAPLRAATSSRGRGRGGRTMQRTPRAGPKKNLTAADLDADLDAYTNKM